MFFMPIPIQKLREIAFHLLYSDDFESTTEETFFFLMRHHLVSKKNVYSAYALVTDLKKHLEEIDRSIREHAKEYEFNRIPRVEKNLLRLGIYEMLYSKKTPAKVAISESIRLARKFATAESAHFINAVLDAIYKKPHPV